VNEAAKTLRVKFKNTFFVLIILVTACASSESAQTDPTTGETMAKLNARPLGVSVIELPNTNAISIKLKFDCQDANYKIRMFKYKIRVTENDKEIQTEGLQKSWLEKNTTIVNLRYPKNRSIKFKSIEISAHSWVRSFPDSQLSTPIGLTSQQCKELAPY
jgi:hypothetical protein